MPARTGMVAANHELLRSSKSQSTIDMNDWQHSRRTFLATAASGAALRAASAPDPNTTLWYDKPAANWNEALPIGNGSMGAMIFGAVEQELLQLNEDTLTSSEPGADNLPLDIAPEFDEVVRLLRQRQYAEAADIASKKWTGRSWPCYQPLGDLRFEFPGASDPKSYRRELDLDTAVSRVSYTSAGNNFTREYFASFPHRVIAVRFTASKAGSLAFDATLASVHPTATSDSSGAREIRLRGQAPGLALRRALEWIEQRKEQWKYPEIWNADGSRKPNAKTVLYGKEIGGKGMFFEGRLRLLSTDGRAISQDGKLNVEGATKAVLLFVSATSYNGFRKSPSREGSDPSKQCEARLASLSDASWAALRSAHISDYQRLYRRATLSLGAPTSQSHLTTDERVRRFSSGEDPSLAVLYFQYARYLKIAGSRPGTQPLNLQGIWNPMVIPPWASQ